MEDIVLKMAFSFLKRNLTADTLREFESRGVDAEEFFTLPTKDLIQKLGIRQDHDFDKIAREEALSLANKEYERIKGHSIKVLYVLDEDYPQRLAETEDAPIILYKLGEADLEEGHFVSVVGTRRPTPYGLDFCNKIVEEIGVYFPEATIVSGLAYGIDSAAHKKALFKGLCTIAVVAHGLNMIYPAANRNLAKEIIRSGGAIISEYPFDTKPFPGNFLARNRIVAGISDATIVVESKVRGGAMSTANYAFHYNREVMALPGRISDETSMGCNHLIRKNKAQLISGVADLIETTGWQPLNIQIDATQRNLFPELEGNQRKIYELLKNSQEPVQVDEIVHKTGLPANQVMTILGELEFDGIIMRYPGSRFSLS